MNKFYFDDVVIGKTFKSQGRTITETDIVNFAGLSGDFNPLHMDAEFAKTNMFEKRIAHGLLGLSVASGLQVDEPQYHIEAFAEVSWKFKRPIYIGDTVHVEAKAIEKKDTRFPERGMVLVERKLINQDGKVTQEGIFHLLVRKKS